MRFEIWQKGVVAGGSLLLVLTTGVCTGTAPPASTPDNALTNHPVSPTPDIEATVQARVKDERAVEATVEAKAPALAKTLVEATAKAAPSQTSTFTPALSPTPTPKPEVQIVTEERDLQLANFAWTRDWMGKQDLIGVVRNEGTSTLSGVSVTLEFLDRAGRRAVDVRDASVLLAGEIGPGEQVPFVSGLPEATGGERWDLVIVHLKVNPMGSYFGRKVDGLEIKQLEKTGGGVRGVISNGSNETLGGTDILEGFEVAVIGYSTPGQVVVVGETAITALLQPGWSADFQISVWGDPAFATRYEARVLVR